MPVKALSRTRPSTRARRENAAALAEANSYAAGRGYASGLKVNLNTIDEEYVPALKSWAGRVDLYQKMGNDAKIAAQLRANILPLISAVRWKVEGGDSEARDLIAANLLREAGSDPDLWCDTSWTQRIFESFLCLQYGISLFGKTREVVDGYTIFRALTYLHPRSLGGPKGPWEWDETGSRLVAIHRAYRLPSGAQVYDERIAIEDLFPVVWWMAGENWEGVPLLRSMYRAYVEKDLASKIQMIDLQNRGVGIPDVETAPNDGAKEMATLIQIAKDLRGGSKERAFIARSSGQKVGFLTSSGTTLDAGPIISGKNNELASGGSTDFMQSGQTESGSRATSSVLMVSYMQALDAERVVVQEQINHGAGYCMGLVEELCYANGFDDCPEIRGTCVNPSDQLDNVQNILDGIQKGGLTHDLAVENHVRKSMGIEAMTALEFQKAKDVNRPVPSLGGRPDSPTPIDVSEPRNDKAGRAFGLTDAQKKTLGASRTTRSAASFGWLRSTPS